MDFKARIGVLFTIVLLFGTSAAMARTIQLVGLGDSLMAGYELPSELAFAARLEKALRDKGHEVNIINAGVSGDTSADGLARLDWSVADGTDGVILELGANDALRGLPPAETRKNIDAIIMRLKERNIAVLLIGILAPPNMGPDYQQQFNSIYPDLAAKYDLDLYPFFLDGVALDPKLQLKDGMHPNGEGTQVMAKRVLPMAEKFLGKIANRH